MTPGQPPPDNKPRFRAVRDHFAARGIVIAEYKPFKNHDDVVFPRFTKDGKVAMANYKDDDLIEPEVIDQWCRTFGVDPSTLHIECENGHVSVSVPPDDKKS